MIPFIDSLLDLPLIYQSQITEPQSRPIKVSSLVVKILSEERTSLEIEVHISKIVGKIVEIGSRLAASSGFYGNSAKEE